MRKFFLGLFIVGIGGFIWASNLELISVSFRFSRDWPILMVAVGLICVWDSIFEKHWWSRKCFDSRKEKKNEALKVLEELEKGNISAEEAIRRMGG
ncbi:MAG: hypothetical protein COT18_02890 [Elusimicrobia bacterium CG08_land_8_20_14_0_20_59_10]|nr:MAG: hypothetical protein COT18_02890 [Elusimicrobia bacterium CG08_land_8_20_14_0_20_59_10]